MTEPGELMEDPLVQRWLVRSGYESRPEGERRAALADLAEFCAFTGRTPAELVESCLRETPEGLRKINISGRRSMQAAIDAYLTDRGLSGRDAILVGNRVRGFLVHNGVFIQGPAAIR